MHFHGSEPFPQIWLEMTGEDEQWKKASMSQMKKIRKIWIREVNKANEKLQKQNKPEPKVVPEKKDETILTELEASDAVINAPIIKIRDVRMHIKSR
ncbi:unnamed protein product, partial [Soboliphyme baturini]|uniref:NFACT-R_1 domain-containing protein n=1 Tax=Soboliphyme baturini TaxID=241478 RepID=A0A183JB16_9BILA